MPPFASRQTGEPLLDGQKVSIFIVYLPKVMGFLQVPWFPPTGNVDRVRRD